MLGTPFGGMCLYWGIDCWHTANEFIELPLLLVQCLFKGAMFTQVLYQ